MGLGPGDVVDLGQLKATEAQYVLAVRDHLASLTPWWLDGRDRRPLLV
jgi:hypothetical protein